MTRRATTPHTWPPRMLADMAAGYVGERHVEDFLERVGTSYPLPRVSESAKRRFWYRDDLDRAIINPATVLAVNDNSLGAKFRESRKAKGQIRAG